MYQFIGPENITKKARQLLLHEQDGVTELQGMFIVAHLLVVTIDFGKFLQ